MRKTRLATLLLLCSLQPVTSFAINGVQEINQTCAAVLGCLGGDTAGYPVTIDGSSGNSYRLTSDLVVPDENTKGISITTFSRLAAVENAGNQ